MSHNYVLTSINRIIYKITIKGLLYIFTLTDQWVYWYIVMYWCLVSTLYKVNKLLGPNNAVINGNITVALVTLHAWLIVLKILHAVQEIMGMVLKILNNCFTNLVIRIIWFNQICTKKTKNLFDPVSHSV